MHPLCNISKGWWNIWKEFATHQIQIPLHRLPCQSAVILVQLCFARIICSVSSSSISHPDLHSFIAIKGNNHNIHQIIKHFRCKYFQLWKNKFPTKICNIQQLKKDHYTEWKIGDNGWIEQTVSCCELLWVVLCWHCQITSKFFIFRKH